MISARDVGQMSDEEIAERLNDNWRMIVGLMTRLGGDVRFSEKEVAELDTNVVITSGWSHLHDELRLQMRPRP